MLCFSNTKSKGLKLSETLVLALYNGSEALEDKPLSFCFQSYFIFFR